MRYIILRLLRKINLLPHLNFYIKIILNKKIFKIPILGGVGIENCLRISEPWMTNLLEQLTKDNENKEFLDVGVNLGQTLLKLKSVNADIKYFGFEPNPQCVHYLNSLIALNKWRDVQVIPAGLSSSSEIIQLKLYSDSLVDSSASILDNFRGSDSVKSIMNVSVFSYGQLAFTKDFNAGIIKIDVEGAELEVLEGFKNTLIQKKPFVIVEILPAYSDQNHNRISRQNKIKALLDEINYSILRIIKNDDKLFGFKRIDDFGIHSDLNNCDYLFVPNELTKRFE